MPPRIPRAFIASRSIVDGFRVAAFLVAISGHVAFAGPATAIGMVENPCPDAIADPPELDALGNLEMDPASPDPAVRARLVAAVTAWFQRAQSEHAGEAPTAERDWANLCRFKRANAALAGAPRPRVVFLGDSITEGWLRGDPTLFAHGNLNRGISGQTTPQMLVRFYADVVALHPRAVHILAGTNDVAGNTGPNSPQDFMNNIRAMTDLARANGIKVLIGSIPPSSQFNWRPDIKPAPRISELNAWLERFAADHHAVFVDYHAALAAPDGSMRADLTHDGVHPHRTGYAVMRPLAEAAIARALR
jgi:lysophospholipase L1-like esterase